MATEQELEPSSGGVPFPDATSMPHMAEPFCPDAAKCDSHCPATHSRALGQGPHLSPLWLEATLGAERGEGGAGPRRKVKGAPKTSISKINTSSIQYF